MRKIIDGFKILTVAIFVTNSISAYDFKAYNGADTIFYKFTDNPKIVYVTGDNQGKTLYAGDIVVPEKVSIDDKEYIVGGIGESAFKNCSALTSVKLPISIERIEADAFRNCIMLQHINLPEYLLNIGYFAFGNTSLKDVKIPAVKEIEGMAFRGCKNLKTVTMHDSIKVIGDYAFMDCVNLKKANLPKAMERLGRSAFFNCYQWGDEVTIWKKAKLIGLYAFGNCFSLKTIKCEGTAYIPYCEKFAFGDVRPIDKILKILPGTKGIYERMQEWQDFKEIIEE